MNDSSVLQNQGMTDSAYEGESTPADQQVVEGASVDAGVPADAVQTDGADEQQEPQSDAGGSEVEQLRRELERMEQRYRSLAGVARSKDQQLEHMRQLLEELSEKMTTAEERSRPSPIDEVVTPRDVEDLGEDTVAFVRRVAEAAIGAAVSKLEARISKLEEQVNGVQQVASASAEQQFMATLDKKLPEWRKINEDPAFIEWLQASSARVSGFQAAANAMDAEGVLVFFKAYAAENGLLQSGNAAKRAKRRNVAPGKSKGGAPAAGQGNNQKVWTRAEIAEFYAHGRKRYSAEEFRRIEQDIFRAQQEGRIQL